VSRELGAIQYQVLSDVKVPEPVEMKLVYYLSHGMAASRRLERGF
jgi:hypothetical protein